MAKELSEIFDQEIAMLGKESSKHRLQFRICQTLVIVLTATSSVVSGWALKQDAPSKDAYLAIVIITALATAISAWLEMKRSRDLWQHERPLYHALRDLKRELEFRESIGELTIERKKELFSSMAQVLGQAGKKWVKLTQEKEPNSESSVERSRHRTPDEPARPE